MANKELLAALLGTTVKPEDTLYGTGLDVIAARAPQMYNPYMSTGQTLGVALGTGLTSALLGHMARNEAAQQNAEMQPLLAKALTASTPEEVAAITTGQHGNRLSEIALNSYLTNVENKQKEEQAKREMKNKLMMTMAEHGITTPGFEEIMPGVDISVLRPKVKAEGLDPTAKAYIDSGLASPEDEFFLRTGQKRVSDLLANKKQQASTEEEAPGVKPPTVADKEQAANPAAALSNEEKEPVIESLPDPRTTSKSEYKAAEARIRQQEKDWQRWDRNRTRQDRNQQSADAKLNNGQFYKEGYEPTARAFADISNLVKQRGGIENLTQADAQKMVTMVQKMIDKSQVTLGEFKTYGRSLGSLTDRWTSQLSNKFTGASEISTSGLRELYNFADSLNKTHQEEYRKQADMLSGQYDVKPEKFMRTIGVTPISAEEAARRMAAKGYVLKNGVWTK